MTNDAATKILSHSLWTSTTMSLGQILTIVSQKVYDEFQYLAPNAFT